MTSKDAFTAEEWAHLKRAPFVAGMAISLADPGGPIEAFKETKAALDTVVRAEQDGRDAFVVAIARDVAEEAKHRHSPLGDFKPKGAMAGQAILDELAEANRIVTAKAEPEEAAAFRAWLLAAAQASADAAKEGGFMGWHAERVSAGEREMLDRLGGVLAAPAG